MYRTIHLTASVSNLAATCRPMDGDSAEPAGRDWTRIGLVVGCLCAAVAVTLLMPAFAVDGLAGSPLEQVLPGESAAPNPGAGSGGGGGGLGALSPGAGTGVGGKIGLNSETFATTSTEVHFVVESSKRTYWRTAAYGTYTGSGWTRSTETSPVDGRISHPGPDGERIDYEITLKKRASAVPTAYRPALVSGIENPLVSDNGAVQAGSSLSPGTTIEGVSFAPRNDVDRLRSTSESYPDAIEDRFTQLPEDTPDRIAERTESVFEQADADDPYEKARAVQEYLRSNKEYDLSVSERSNSIADTFIFEMDAGYCEYFATSMAVMLRSQGIPARYVVGYTSGQRVGENTYEVRGMNAHAWVEVYFESVGWVRFDPTPGNERLQRQQEALENVDGEFDIEDPGSPGEAFSPGGQGSDADEQTGLETSLNRTAVPGTAVELTVTYNDAAVPGVEVLFNGESVGITDRNGTVVGTVPDAEELTVQIREGTDATPDALETAIFDSEGNGTDQLYESPEGNATVLGGSSSAAGSLGSAPTTATTVSSNQVGRPSLSQSEEPTDTHPIDRTASIVTSGEPAPGGELLLTARIGDVVIDGATVRVDGQRVGRTNESGQLVIELPDRTGDVTVTVERDPISGERTITIPELTLSVETGPLGPNPFGAATVTARLDGEPAAGVPVTVAGEQVAVTDANGTAEVSLPFSPTATISVRTNGQTISTTLTGLLYVPAGVGLGLLALLGLVGYVLGRRGIGPQAIGQLFRGVLAKGIGGLQNGFVALVTDGDRYVVVAVRRIRSGLRTVGGVFTGTTSLSQLRREIGGIVDRIWRVVRSDAGSDHSSGEQLTVREAWNRFLDSVSADSTTTSTPGELADHAVEEDGLPEQPVAELRDTFREVEYGSRSPSDRLERVQQAIEQIEQTEGRES
nr:transglutaminaseTgpA domain-containing protein [Halovenus carboxidivorans]